MGDPAAMHVFAVGLTRRAAELSASADQLGSRWGQTSFEGPASRRLRERVERDRRTLLAVGDELAELGARVRSEAFALEMQIARWEQYRDQWMQQQAAAARPEGTSGS